MAVLEKHRRLLAQALGSSSVRTSFRDQRMLDFHEMGYSLDLPSIGKPLKQPVEEQKSGRTRRAEEG